MNTYTLIREQTCVIIAPDATTAKALSAGSVWINQPPVRVAQVIDADGRDITPLPFGNVDIDEADGLDDAWHDHQAREAARLAGDERDAVWVGDAA